MVCLVSAAPANAEQSVLIAREDAYVRRDTDAREWAIGSGGLELVVGFNAQGTLSLKRLWNPETGRVSYIRGESDAALTIDGQTTPLQESGTLVRFLSASGEGTNAGVQLTLMFEHRDSHAVITRVFVTYPGSPTFETWTHVDSAQGSPVRVSGFTGWQLTAPNAPVKWINGLRGSTSAAMDDSSFAVQGGMLDEGGHVEIGSERRSSEAYVPLLFVQGEQETLFGGVIWSGAWRVTVDRLGDSLSLSAEFPAVALTTSSERSVEFPHSFFGVADPRPGSESRALNRFVLGLRAGRPIWPLVTYNTWFAYGSRIDESSVAEEIVRAAGLGVELFVLDAGWYENAGAEEQYDFTSGLGSWRIDGERFERGLTVLSDLAHEHGMKFGLWVEPERVALSTINQAGLADQEWLATQDGAYGDGRSAQLCLASVAAQEWVFDKLVALIDQVRPDYLKWDNNFWINCNREGHGHGTEEGSYSHVATLYGLLAKLRHRYPEMIVENVSGGGNRLDYGMLALTDVGWMDDRSEPSNRVRHNFQGLALAFPPAYLLSFVIDSEREPLGSTEDFRQIARSRMTGALGFTYRYQQLDARLSGQIRESIAAYKGLREIVSRSYAVMLSGQAPVENGWDVMEEIADDQRAAVIFAFTSVPGEGGTVVRPVGLVPELFYDVRSFDSGYLGKLTGTDLMRDGIHVVHLESSSRAHVITLMQAPSP